MARPPGGRDHAGLPESAGIPPGNGRNRLTAAVYFPVGPVEVPVEVAALLLGEPLLPLPVVLGMALPLATLNGRVRPTLGSVPLGLREGPWDPVTGIRGWRQPDRSHQCQHPDPDHFPAPGRS